MSRRQIRGFFVTDDRDAAREAAAEGIKVVSTWDLLRLFVRGGRMTVSDFHIHAATLVGSSRGCPPGWPDRNAIELWLGVTR